MINLYFFYRNRRFTNRPYNVGLWRHFCTTTHRSFPAKQSLLIDKTLINAEHVEAGVLDSPNQRDVREAVLYNSLFNYHLLKGEGFFREGTETLPYGM